MTAPRPSCPHGFSTLQLLVVLALIVALAALMYPAFNSQIAMSRNMRCIQNLKNVGVGFAAYAADRNGMIPPRNLGNFRTSGREPAHLRPWASRMVNFGYIENPDVLYCPLFTPFNEQGYREQFNKGVKEGGNRTYGVRTWGPPNRYGEFREEEKRLAWIEEPSQFFIVADSYWTAWQMQGYGITPGASAQGVHLRHKGKANALFADGHVAAKDADYFAQLHLKENQGRYSNGTETRDGAIIHTISEDPHGQP